MLGTQLLLFSAETATAKYNRLPVRTPQFGFFLFLSFWRCRRSRLRFHFPFLTGLLGTELLLCSAVTAAAHSCRLPVRTPQSVTKKHLRPNETKAHNVLLLKNKKK